MTVREAASELHAKVADHFTFCGKTPPAIYKALIELRRAMTAEDQGKVPSLVSPEIKEKKGMDKYEAPSNRLRG